MTLGMAATFAHTSWLSWKTIDWIAVFKALDTLADTGMALNDLMVSLPTKSA